MALVEIFERNTCLLSWSESCPPFLSGQLWAQQEPRRESLFQKSSPRIEVTSKRTSSYGSFTCSSTRPLLGVTINWAQLELKRLDFVKCFSWFDCLNWLNCSNCWSRNWALNRHLAKGFHNGGDITLLLVSIKFHVHMLCVTSTRGIALSERKEFNVFLCQQKNGGNQLTTKEPVLSAFCTERAQSHECNVYLQNNTITWRQFAKQCIDCIRNCTKHHNSVTEGSLIILDVPRQHYRWQPFHWPTAILSKCHFWKTLP